MAAILLVLAWPVGMAAIIAAGVLLARRAGHEAAPDRPPAATGTPLSSAARFLLSVAVDAAVVFAVMFLLGLLVAHAGPAIDRPVFGWVAAHRAHFWAAQMSKATRAGDTWTVRGAAVAAAFCLAVSCRRMRWLPPLAIGTIIALQHPLTSAIHRAVHRLGPPGHMHGTFPSGGCERCVAFYGLIAYLLWREFSGTRRGAIGAGTVVGLLAFNEAYSRTYLGMHWLTDTLSGWVYGGLLLAVFVGGMHMAARPWGRSPAAPPTSPPAATATASRQAARPGAPSNR